MKNVVSFVLGMAASIVVIKMFAKDEKYFDDLYEFNDFIEEDENMMYRQPRKTVNIAEEARKKERKLLLLEQDYELTSLYDAISTQDETEIARSKARLTDINSELEGL